MDDPDAIWKPGYQGPMPVESVTVASTADGSDDSSPELPSEPPNRPVRSRSRFGVGIAVVVVALVGVAIVAFDPFDSGGEPDQDVAPDRLVFGGPDDRRLPQLATELWSVDMDVDDVSGHWVVGRDLVVAAVEGGVGAGTALVAFDALTGEQRWAFPLDATPSDVKVVGSVGDVFVVEQPGESSPTVIGIDTETGETRWSADSTPNAGHVAVVGTTSIARLPSVPGGSVSMIDALSGRELPPSPDGPTADEIRTTGVPMSVGSRSAVSGSNFVTTAPGSISGVVVEGEVERVVWSRNDGAVVDQHPIDGGLLLQIATRGGAGMELVDGLTGETVENLAMVPGALQALVVAGDGVVALRPAVLGSQVVAIDFDGTERWSILGSEPVVVGDRIVARATSIDGRLRISAFGDLE